MAAIEAKLETTTAAPRVPQRCRHCASGECIARGVAVGTGWTRCPETLKPVCWSAQVTGPLVRATWLRLVEPSCVGAVPYERSDHKNCYQQDIGERQTELAGPRHFGPRECRRLRALDRGVLTWQASDEELWDHEYVTLRSLDTSAFRNWQWRAVPFRRPAHSASDSYEHRCLPAAKLKLALGWPETSWTPGRQTTDGCCGRQSLLLTLRAVK